MKKAPKKKNDRTLFIAAVIVFALAVGLFVGSYARYYNSYTGTGSTATAAAWDFTVNGSASNFTLDLTDTSSCTVTNLANGHIQPGSSGSCDIVLAATNSEVPVIYTITFGSLAWQGGTDAPGFTWSIASVPVSGDPVTVSGGSATGEIAAGGSVTYRISWNWTWDGNETTTQYNSFAGKTLTLSNTTVVGYQKNPNA